MLKLRNISKTFSQTIVLKNINLDIEDNEFVVLVGPSGCGKSTLVRIIAGLETEDSGSIVFNGNEIQNLDPKDRHLAMVFQNYALYPHKTVFDNIAFPLKISGEKNIQTTVENIARKLSIGELLKRKPRELSGGQRQRVALARAMIKNPEIFLLDEPLSNLDAKLRVQMRQEIFNLRKNLQSTFIYVTHDQVEAMTLGDRIVVLQDGQIEQIGSPEEIYNKPANTFVASFIGSPATNLIETEEYIIGIRPEYLKLKTDGHQGKIQIRITNIEETGSEKLIYGEPLSMMICDKKFNLVGKNSIVAKVQDNVVDLKKGLEGSLVIDLYFNDDMLYYFNRLDRKLIVQ